jgi:pimeloyl-ACP methyl ester carboxylesterase
MSVRPFTPDPEPLPEDSLQIAGALITPSGGPAPGSAPDADNPVTGLGSVADQYVRRLRGAPGVRMMPGSIRAEGRLLRYAVSDNVGAHGPDGPGTPPVWAVNIHGYFAGGGMYWRESARLAEQMGWRVVNPSLPGFGGSEPLGWQEISLDLLAAQVRAILREVGAGPVVLLGHSMGGAVAVQFAYDHPRETLGVVYRDGVSTPAWKERKGLIAAALSPMLPDMVPLVDMLAAVVLDLPDLAIGRMYSTVRAVLPDMRQNLRAVARTLPVGTMLMGVDQRSQIRRLVARQIPILNEWGCFDRVIPGHTALEFASVARAPVVWIPGGHSWMLARPQGQADILTHVARGREFVHRLHARRSRLTPGGDQGATGVAGGPDPAAAERRVAL